MPMQVELLLIDSLLPHEQVVEKKVVTSHVEAGTGQGNQNDRTLHFGLTDHEGPLKLQVHWIDGEAQQVDAEPGKLVVIRRVEKK